MPPYANFVYAWGTSLPLGLRVGMNWRKKKRKEKQRHLEEEVGCVMCVILGEGRRLFQRLCATDLSGAGLVVPFRISIRSAKVL